jgi:hypothetical protein
MHLEPRAFQAAESGDSPSVSDVIEAMGATQGAIVSELRDSAQALAGVEERTLFDGFCREWTPAFYAQGIQLFHVHNFRAELRATIFVGVNTLGPLILESDEVSPEMRLLLTETSAPRGTMQVRVSLTSSQDVAGFMDMVRVKYAFAQRYPRKRSA